MTFKSRKKNKVQLEGLVNFPVKICLDIINSWKYIIKKILSIQIQSINWVDLFPISIDNI